MFVGLARREALGAPLARRARAQPVDGQRRVVVEPDDVLAVEVAAGLGVEAAGRRGAVGRRDVGNLHVTDPRHRMVAAREAQQHRRRADGAAVRGIHMDAGVALVDDGEGQAMVVATLLDPVHELLHIGGDLACRRAEHRERAKRHSHERSPRRCHAQSHRLLRPDRKAGRRGPARMQAMLWARQRCRSTEMRQKCTPIGRIGSDRIDAWFPAPSRSGWPARRTRQRSPRCHAT